MYRLRCALTVVGHAGGTPTLRVISSSELMLPLQHSEEYVGFELSKH